MEETPEAKSERLTRLAHARLREELLSCRGGHVHGEVKAVLTLREGKVVKVVVLRAAEEV